MAEKRLFIFGLGFSARALAHQLLANGWVVAGTTRDREKAAALRREGIEAHILHSEGYLQAPSKALGGTTHLLSSVPPDDDGDPVVRAHREALTALASQLAWVGYLSTTGVYGDRDGAWVDESAALMPTGTRGQRRVAAERNWQELAETAGLPLHIFRLAGIYGPGRSALTNVRRGTARRIDKPGQVFARIHVADIATVLMASMARPNPGAIYNVCDDAPAPPGDVVAYACQLLGVTPPEPVPFERAELSPMAASFYRDNKRVDNGRIKRELGISLAYPDYRAGLEALYAKGTY